MTYRKLSRDFVNSRKGNFAMLFALSTLPIIASVGMLVEYNNMSKTQAQLQAALDATALIVAKDFNETGKLMKKKDIEDLLEVNFDGTLLKVKPTQVNGELLLEAEAKTGAIFSSTFGLSFTQSADVTVPLKGDDINAEIALVLDSTGSMSLDNKMVDLQRVAKDFIADIFTKSGGGIGAKISVVPFAKFVNVGVSNRNQSWIDVEPDHEKTYCRMVSDPLDPASCYTETLTSAEGVPYQQQVCNGGYGPEYEKCDTWMSNWAGCVGSRAYPLNTQDAAYSTRIPGLHGARCPSALTPLTETQSTLEAAIDSLVPNGDTFIGTGVMWGLRTLSPEAPFTEGTAGSATMMKVMIVMTDGDNTIGPWPGGGWHSNTDVASSDDQTLLSCKEARNAGITIYTIAFGTTVSPTGKAVMRDCASDPQKFFDASDADKLESAFESIAGDIYRLKLSS